MSDQIRKQFEAWHCESDEGPQTDPHWMIFNENANCYALDKIQRDWLVWQASRAALVIDLSLASIEVSHGCHGNEENVFSAAQKAIEAAGVRVQP